MTKIDIYRIFIKIYILDGFNSRLGQKPKFGHRCVVILTESVSPDFNSRQRFNKMDDEIFEIDSVDFVSDMQTIASSRQQEKYCFRKLSIDSLNRGVNVIFVFFLFL